MSLIIGKRQKSVISFVYESPIIDASSTTSLFLTVTLPYKSQYETLLAVYFVVIVNNKCLREKSVLNIRPNIDLAAEEEELLDD